MDRSSVNQRLIHELHEITRTLSDVWSYVRLPPASCLLPTASCFRVQNLRPMTFAHDRFKPATRTPTMQALALLFFIVCRCRQSLYDFPFVIGQFIPRASHTVAPFTSGANGPISFSHNRSSRSSNTFVIFRASSWISFACSIISIPERSIYLTVVNDVT